MHLYELEDGLVYRVRHERYFPTDAIAAKPSSKGGRTTVEIGRMVEFEGEKRFDVLISAVSVCSVKENYSKKRGRDIALGRALFALRRPDEVLRRAETPREERIARSRETVV